MQLLDGKCLIISAGEFSDLPDDYKTWDYIIACDAGWQYAKRMGLTPDIIIGDFDSSERPGDGIPVEVYPKRKDDTDTMLAAKHALEKGYRDITICCVFGGRADHMLANVQTAAFIVSKGGWATLLGTDTRGCAFTASTKVFPRLAHHSFSVFSLSDKCTGVSIKGACYGCEDIELTNTFPLGVSNEWDSDRISVTVGSGILLVVESRMT